MNGVSIIEGILIAIGTGAVMATVSTILQAKVNSIHVEYTRETLIRHGKEISRLDEKITEEIRGVYQRIERGVHRDS